MTSDPKPRGIAIFPPRPSHVSRQEAEESVRRREKARKPLTAPFPCHGKGCRLHTAASIMYNEPVPRVALAVRGPRGKSDRPERIILTGDPIPGTDMMFRLDGLPTILEIQCSCGYVNKLHRKPLQQLARSLATL